ncbi:MAG: serine protease [Rariglobus sp.]|nr:serine protease [Rariglobus sp.]
MFFSRFAPVLCVLIFAVGSAMAQDAQAILDATAKVYTETQAYSVQVDRRMLQIAFAPNQAGVDARYDVSSSQFSRMQIKVRRPLGYWLSVQSAGQGAPMVPSRDVMGEMRMIGGGASSTILARTENGQAKRGSYQAGKFTVQDIPEHVFNSMSGSLLGLRSADDVVLRHFNPQSALGGNMALGLVEPDLIGREAINGRRIYRIVAKTSGGSPVMVWIDQESSQVVRSIVQRPAGGAGQASRYVSVTETLYNYQQMNPSFSSSDFVLTASVPLERLVPEQMGFIPVADLVKLADIAPAAGAGTVAGAPANEPPAAPVATTPPPAAPAAPDAKAAEGQALSYEQMSGIVLIEGDGGTATGFITKIRDVDFVVTNLHVLGGNKKMIIKTLRGDEIPMLGVFGAAGSDIAIIRISKGQGELKLAEDVLKTSKIGDKVVVVGNRQGGGVATQVAGSIVGVGPTRVEVNANFEPGNSGSPIVNLGTGEVVGVASYSETRQVSVEEHTGQPAARTRAAPTPVAVEKRWFGYRLDSVAKWEAIDLAKWNSQEERIGKFTEMSEALVAVLRLDFNKARQHPRLSSLITSFETRMRSTSGTGVSSATEVKDLFRVIRTISEDGVNDLKNGDYYDYYRTCLYWESSIPAQLEYRKAIIEVLKKYEANSAGYLSRMRGGS